MENETTPTKPAVDTARPLAIPRHPVLAWIFRHPFLTIILVGVVLYQPYSWLMGPSLNSQPTQKIVIRGSFPFSKGFDLVLDASYTSKNPTCRQMARTLLIFPAAEVNRNIDVPVPVQREGEDRYRAEVVLDYVSPGFCEWKFSGMGYRVTGNKQSDTGVSGLGDIPHRANNAEMVCRYRQVLKFDRLIVACDRKIKPNDDSLKGETRFDFIWEGEQ